MDHAAGAGGRPGATARAARSRVIPGVVFSGGWDGVLRALEADRAASLWQYDTQRDFETVNRVPARGGSMGAPGPTVAGGMVFVGSGLHRRAQRHAGQRAAGVSRQAADADQPRRIFDASNGIWMR